MSDTSLHHARVVWHGDKQDLRAHTIHLSDQTLAGSSAAARGGDPTKADPEEMFVAALSVCHIANSVNCEVTVDPVQPEASV
jgi:organic hydroperoxide reductase OsmC/OhrA